MPKWKPDEVVSGYFSACGLYRYWLKVEWSALPWLVVIGLNPSRADIERDDNTVRKCVNWAKAHGYGALLMLNCYSFRATDPKDMRAAADPFGEQTTVYLAGLSIGKTVVAAWGGGAKHRNQGNDVALELRRAGIPLHCFGINQDGSPLHPCYAKMPEKLMPWLEASTR